MIKHSWLQVCVVAVCLVLGSIALGGAPAEFRTWLERDNAMRKNADAEVLVGDFRLSLPLGWIVESGKDGAGEVALAYIGPRATQEPARVRAIVSVDTAPLRDRGGAAEAWPSEFSGWTTFRVGELWAVRAVEPADRDGEARLVVEVPTALATLITELTVPAGDGPWPLYLQQLLQKLVYVGTGIPLAPPGKGDDKSRAAARTPDVRVAAYALGESPLHAYVTKTRQALHQGVDPSSENYVTVLDTGFDALLARLHMVRSAQHSIRIQKPDVSCYMS